MDNILIGFSIQHKRQLTIWRFAFTLILILMVSAGCNLPQHNENSLFPPSIERESTYLPRPNQNRNFTQKTGSEATFQPFDNGQPEGIVDGESTGQVPPEVNQNGTTYPANPTVSTEDSNNSKNVPSTTLIPFTPTPQVAANNNKNSLPLFDSAQSSTLGPLKVSGANGRYFENGTGEIVVLAGSHTWANFQDAGETNPPPQFDYQAYLNYLRNNNLNFFRLWTWEQSKWAPWSTGDMWFSPSVYARSGSSANALDGGYKFNLDEFNQAYFDRLRDRVIQAGEKGIYVSIMLFDGWSIGGKEGNPGNAWPGHPYNGLNNINNVNGDANGNGQGEETHTLQIAKVVDYQKAYLRKVIDTVNDLDNVLYEISNESPSNSQTWQYEMINYIKAYESGLAKRHPVGMSVEYPGGNNAELFASPADWVSPNDVGGYKDNPPAANANKVVVVDTDHLWGEGGDRAWVWKSYTRGLNLSFMDCYNDYYCSSSSPSTATRANVTANMGYTLAYTSRMNMAKMVPHGELSSSGYALANPAMDGEYLVYAPSGGTVTVNLSATPGNLDVEWLNPVTGTITADGTVTGGGNHLFSIPFPGDAVLYLHTGGSTQATVTPLVSTPPVLATQTPVQSNTPVPPTATKPSPTIDKITIGETSVLNSDDSGNRNILAAQEADLDREGTIQSLSFYVSAVSGQLRLGIYDNANGKPGKLKAQTNAFTSKYGWNTQDVQNQVLLPPGKYWLAFLPQNNGLHFRASSSGIARGYIYPFKNLADSYSSRSQVYQSRWSLYATLAINPVNNLPTYPATPGAVVPSNSPAPAEPTATPSPTLVIINTPVPTSTQTQTGGNQIKIGEPNVLASDNSGNGNLLIAQQTSLNHSATIESLSFFVTNASGKLRLGIYDDANGTPGKLLAQTSSFNTKVGWNTREVTTPVMLPAGTYWLAYLAQNDNLHFRVDLSGSGKGFSYRFGKMPDKFSDSPFSGSFHFSFFATLSY